MESYVSVTRDVFPGNWVEMVVGGKFFGQDKKKVGGGTTRKMEMKSEENLIKLRTAAAIESFERYK